MEIALNLSFIGFGVLGKQIERLYGNEHGTNYRCRYFDDKARAAGLQHSYDFASWKDALSVDEEYVVALGYKHLRLKYEIVASLIEGGYRLLTFVHNTTYVNPASVVHEGAIVYPMCNIDTGAKIGRGVLLNNTVTVSHDSIVGDCCFLAPGVVLSGNVTIGSGTFIGSGTVISNCVTVGNNVVIGVGSCITKDVENDSYVIGNPMRKIDRGFKLK